MELRPYFQRKDELYVESDCLMWGHRLVVPSILRSAILNELHCTHLGIVKMKAVARSLFWWPQLDKNIEDLTKSCMPCLENKDNPPKVETHKWPWPADGGPTHRM